MYRNENIVAYNMYDHLVYIYIYTYTFSNIISITTGRSEIINTQITVLVNENTYLAKT